MSEVYYKEKYEKYNFMVHLQPMEYLGHTY